MSAQPEKASLKRMVESHLPILFEPVSYQGADTVDMIGRMAGMTVGFRPASVVVGSPTKDAVPLQIDFDGAQRSVPIGTDLEKSQTNYLLGNDPARWRTHVPNYAKVNYAGLYPGIDAVFYGNGPYLEHDFIVRPGADYRQIRMRFPQDAQVSVGKDGALRIALKSGSLEMKAPLIYQDEDGKRQQRSGAFQLLADGDVGFTVENYDPRHTLVIDPVLSFSTYVSTVAGGGNLIATDASGNNYITGIASLGFPVTPGAFAGCASCASGTYISKMSADGSNLIYSTVLGGNSFAQPVDIAVDTNGNAIVAGWTGASNFPTKSGQPIFPQNNDYVGFLVSLSPDGSSLNYGTLLGSSPSASIGRMTYASAVALDASGNAYVTGETGAGFFVSDGALNLAAAGSIFGEEFDIYLAKFSPSGTLLYSAVLGTADPQNGGGGPIGASAIAVDATGNAFVAGQAGALWPITNNAYLKQIAGPMPYATPFVMKVAPDAKSVVYSTYLDYAYVVKGLGVLSNENVFVSGSLAGPTYPTTPDAFELNNGNGGPFLTELDAAGSNLVYSTIVCGGSCYVNKMALDSNGNIWLAVQTSNQQFPLVTPLQSTFPLYEGVPGPVAAVNEFDPTGRTLKFSTLLGGNGPGLATGIAVDSNLRAHVGGAAQYGMYTTPGVYLGSLPLPDPSAGNGIFDFVTVVDPTVPGPGLCASPNSELFFGNITIGATSDQQLTITSCGTLPLSITGESTASNVFSIPASKNGCPASLPVGQSCTLTVRFQPASGGDESSTMVVESGAPVPAMLHLIGSGAIAPIATLSATTLTFGPQEIGTTSASQTVTLTNTGNATLNYIGFELFGDYQSIFPLTYTCGPSLNPGDSCTFSVAFKPASAGTTTINLIVESNANPGFQSVILTGTSPQVPFVISTQTGGSTTSTVSAGSPATYGLAITPAGGYSGNVSLTCNSLPTNASCSINPGSFALAGGHAANFTVTIATESTAKAAVWRNAGLGSVFAACLILLPFSRKRKMGVFPVGIILLMFAVAGVSACGGGSGTSAPPQSSKVASGTYTIHVVASDGSSLQTTQAITLVVQ